MSSIQAPSGATGFKAGPSYGTSTGFGCSCSFMVCGCAYPPSMMRILIIGGSLMFFVAMIVIWRENYCTYADMQECNIAYDSYCTHSAIENHPKDLFEVAKQSCQCRFCDKCAKKSEDATVNGFFCRAATATIENKDETLSRKINNLIQDKVSEWGLSPWLY